MSASNYWTLFLLSASGRAIPKLMLSAKSFFQKQFAENQDARSIQSQLLVLSQSSDDSARLALLCLRCYVSYQIVSTCMRLVERFGDRYSFKLTDILPLVLHDEGQTELREKHYRLKLCDRSSPKKVAYRFGRLDLFNSVPL